MVDAVSQVASVVRLRSFTGIIERVVVREHAETIEVSSREEILGAARDGRPPTTVAFKRTDVVGRGIDRHGSDQ